jgi:hypothetical protein
LSKVLDVLQSKLLEQFVMTEVLPFQRLTVDDPLSYQLNTFAFDDVLELRAARDDVAQRLVQKDDHRDNQ